MVPTVPNHFVPALVSLALRFQLQPEKLFRRAGIDLTAARARGAGFSVHEVEHLVEAFIRATELPDLALVLGEHVDPENLGLFGQLVATSSTPRDAMATFSDFKWLLHPSFDLRLEQEGGLAVVRFASNDDTPIGMKPYYAEALLGAVASIGRHFVGDRAMPRRATFRHARPSYVATYERIFRCPLAFEQPYDALFYAQSLLERPLLGAASPYHRTLRAQAEGDLREIQSLPLAQARRVLHARIADADLDIGDVARVLGVSARTLQRRLGEEGKSFRALRDEVRYQRARELLSQGDAAMDVVAGALGYRERANFVRAFTRWAGQSPSRFRADSRVPSRPRTSGTARRR
ncbi:MAG TPA: AraC family transcriptional regulator [Polyangiaceae bacterium]|nr:AraC family transcriptional regulator [Polyangiaceae bacterium]